MGVLLYLILGQLSEYKEGGLVSLGAALQDVHQVGVRVVLNVLTIHLQENVPLLQLGAARVVHNQLHNGAQGRLACRRKEG